MHFLCFGPQYSSVAFLIRPTLLNKKRKNLLICVIQLIETIQSVAQVQRAREFRIEIKLQKGETKKIRETLLRKYERNRTHEMDTEWWGGLRGKD